LGKRNQIYARYIRIMQSADDPNEIYLVLAKDSPMDRKYIRQFDNMFSGKDVILSITILVREKNKKMRKSEEGEVQINDDKKEEHENTHTPFWDADQ